MDGSAQARAVLRLSTSSLKWEQKLETQTFKTGRQSSGNFLQAIPDLVVLIATCSDVCRQALNSVQSLADFSLDASRELLSFADKLAKDAAVLDTEPGENERFVAAPVLQRLHLLAKK